MVIQMEITARLHVTRRALYCLAALTFAPNWKTEGTAGAAPLAPNMAEAAGAGAEKLPNVGADEEPETKATMALVYH